MPTKPKPSKWQPRGIDKGPPIGQLYQEHLDGIVAIADLSSPADVDKLKKAVLAAAFWFSLDLHYESRPRVGPMRAGLQRVFEQVKALRESLPDPDHVFEQVKALRVSLQHLDHDTRSWLGDTLHEFRGNDWDNQFYGGGDTALGHREDMLGELQTVVGQARALLSPPTKGAPKKGALLNFVTRLAVAWAEAKGTQPTRIYDTATNVETGPFFKFANAAAAPFGKTVSGDIIKRVIKAQNK